MSNASFHVRAGQVQARDAQAFVGQVIGNYLAEFLTNVNPATEQVTTITIGGATDDTVYTVTIDDESASYTSDSSATIAEVHAGLIAAIDAAPAVRGKMAPSGTSPSLVLTGVYPGISYTVTVDDESTGDLGSPAATTAADEADSIEFGLGMIKDGYQTDEADPTGYVPATSDFTAQVMTFSYSGVAAGDSLLTTVKFRGQSLTVQTEFTTDNDTTVAQHATDLNTRLDAVFGSGNGIAAAAATGDLTLTAENPGEEFEADSGVAGTGGGVVTKAYTTGPSVSTSYLRVFAGVSKRRHDVEDATLAGDDPAYPPNAGVEVVCEGVIAVENSQSISYGDAVYVSLASATKGQFYNAIGTDYIWLPPEVARWERDERSTGSTSIAFLRVNAAAARRVF